jgi:hypothetical protein
VRAIEVTRATDGSAAQLDDEVDRVVANWVQDHIDETIAAYERELGQHDRATAGVAATLAALRMSRVATLIVGVPAAAQVDPIVASALATGADVQVVPKERLPSDGVGALLRW